MVRAALQHGLLSQGAQKLGMPARFRYEHLRQTAAAVPSDQVEWLGRSARSDVDDCVGPDLLASLGVGA